MTQAQVKTSALALLEMRRRAYRNDLVGYLVNRLGFKREHLYWSALPGYESHKWDGDVDPLARTCELIQSGEWVAMFSGVGTGKSYLAAGIALWFFDCFDDAVVVTVAPKRDQLELNLWKEIHRLHGVWPVGEITTLDVLKFPPSREWVITGFVAGVRASEEIATKAQGFHAEHMLVIFEETPGIDSALTSAFENTCTAKHNLILALGNPDHSLDGLSQFAKQEHVRRVRVSSLDHPNVVLGRDEVPGAQSQTGIRRLANKYGEGHPMYNARVRGIVPEQATDALIQLQWCDDAVKRGREIEFTEEFFKGKRLALGVDVARSDSGDKAAVSRWAGEHCMSVDSFSCPDPNKVGQDLAREIADKKIDSSYVGIDVIGPGGETVGTLKGLGHYVKGIISNDPASNNGNMEQEFVNLRCQMWWQAREDLRCGRITMPNDTELMIDLTTPKWEPKNGKVWVESKEQYKKRLGRSPDKGDAFVYGNWIRQSGGFGMPNFGFITT